MTEETFTELTYGSNYIYFPDIKKKIYYNDDLMPNITLMKRMVRHDRDCVIVVVGDPGSGKSVFAMTLAKALDPTFDASKIFFEGEKLIRHISSPETKKYESFVYDEAREGLSARQSMSKSNKTITDCLAEIRQKNLFIIIVLPDYWDLDSNVANKRSRYLFYIKENAKQTMSEGEDPFERGIFHFYNRKAKRHLFIDGKKYHDMEVGHPSFIGTFCNQYVVDEEEYRRLKAEALRTTRNLDEGKKTLPKGGYFIWDIVKRIQRNRPEMTQKEIAEMLELSQSGISAAIWHIHNNNEKPEEVH
jgi:ABC-type dipeptide/oligopeptide/nickel transport system ATPase component